MTNKRKPILCLDFDGVIHGYQSGWQGAAIVPDPPVPGAVAFIHAAVERFRVCIFSSRSHQPGGIDAMRAWLTMFVMLDIDDRREAEHVLSLIEWSVEKPAALVTIDDRALRFTGQWPSLDDLSAFQPWNKRPVVERLPDPESDQKPASPLDRARACRAAATASTKFGQWVPQHWLDIFMDAYGSEARTALSTDPMQEDGHASA